MQNRKTKLRFAFIALLLLVTTPLWHSQARTNPQFVCPAAIKFTYNLLPTFVIGLTVNHAFTAQNGKTPYTCALTAGKLPPGLSLGQNGLMSGVPTQAGDFFFTIRATDANGCQGSQPYKLTVAGCPGIAVKPTLLATGWVGSPYNATFNASGHASPYTFSVVAGTLPTGLSLSQSGVLSGTPTQAGPFSFTIQATSATGCASTFGYSLRFSIKMQPQPLPPSPARQKEKPSGPRDWVSNACRVEVTKPLSNRMALHLDYISTL